MADQSKVPCRCQHPLCAFHPPAPGCSKMAFMFAAPIPLEKDGDGQTKILALCGDCLLSGLDKKSITLDWD